MPSIMYAKWYFSCILSTKVGGGQDGPKNKRKSFAPLLRYNILNFELHIILSEIISLKPIASIVLFMNISSSLDPLLPSTAAALKD